jgi:CheY-like chemotaxis protein
VEIHPTHFEIANLFGALRGMLRPLFLNQSVLLHFEIEGSPITVFTDEAKVSQILRNFISNALKFTEHGEVRVTARVEGDRVLLAVADTGIGIDAKDRERIFQDFAQVESPLQRKYKGTGLGLPLSRKLAHLLHGEVTLESEVGLGSTFTLNIPMQWETPPPEPPPLEVPVESGVPVLIVENQIETAQVYSKWLRAAGYQTSHSTTTRDARMRIASGAPALILLDILLNGEDAWNLLASMKGNPETAGIPIVVVSTLDDPGKAFHLGADEYLTKPVDRDVLVSTARRFAAPQPPLVLIIDDDEKDRYLLKRRLRGAPIQITEAVSGAEGISIAVAKHPKLIFLDLGMPGMDGFEVLTALKKDNRTSGIPVVIHTSAKLDPVALERLSSNAARVLLKEELSTGEGLNQLTQELGEFGSILTPGE